jgi:hypothetical protein
MTGRTIHTGLQYHEYIDRWGEETVGALGPHVRYNDDHTNAYDQSHDNRVPPPPGFDHRYQIVDSRHGI